ncbi:MAG: hypothetical protein IPJ31_00230 [Bacteroidetes bacterium]|nr:hypothetical protein [Bacteroidota bacterium]MBP6315890.1 hypothetical protein [Chitinophagaceae bacterium]
MLFKIDTKNNFDILTPQMSRFHTKMAEELITLCAQLQKNDKSAIVDIVNIETIDAESIPLLEQAHTQFYQNNLSFAIATVIPSIKSQLPKDLNCTPTLIEAIDIISMEGLERELMNDL